MSAFVPPRSDAQKFEADLVIVNANVHTMDARRPSAEAVAVYGNRVVAVGMNADIKPLIGSRTHVINAQGALVLPGFNDSHVHLPSGGFQLSGVDLRDAATPQEFAGRLPKGRWVSGGDRDHESWPGAPLPTKELIDAFTPERPVFVNRLDGHLALANSYALKLAGVTRRTLDGKNPGGWIPEQKITVEEAARAYTVGSAYAEFAEHVKGTVTPGKLADLVILTQDIFKIDPVDINKVCVRMTIMDGRVVYAEDVGR
jgi:predicted amidohydrolase YtcJ